jgi:nitrogen-specific signal transduction histidine kinase/CheY-like chemotaxis protein
MMVPLLAPGRQHLGFAKVARDFTRRRELEAAHIEAQRMEGLGLFAGGLAHLFNNLLTVSLGNLDLMLRLPAVRASREAQELGRNIMGAERRMAELTQQVLAFAGKARRRMSPVDPCAIVREAIETLRPELPANVAVRSGLPDACPSVVGDPALLRQLVISLVVNAVEAIGDLSGDVTLSAEETRLSADAARSAYAAFNLTAGRYLRLRVVDTGPGLTPEAQAHLFDPFYTTKFSGRGLGLAAALGVARMHGGAIGARSDPGAGTSIDVLLPVAGRAGLHDDAERRTALVADDEELVRSLTSKSLEAMGYTIVQAENGQQAIDIARRLGERIQLVVLDHPTPAQDDPAAVPLLRDLLPDVPLVLMTAAVSPEFAADRGAANQITELRKPFTFDQLAQAVEAATRGTGVSRAATAT